MSKSQPTLPAHAHRDMERNSYNAAFYALGLRWHWDCETYDALVGRSDDPAERIQHYLETRQPHLLKAYEAGFLANAIQQKKAAYRCSDASRGFDWARALDGEIGA
ncbi:MAG: hypothetical protein HY021_10165 [Burkholderiales bacterium]|nr:hypothetical protein [Burkholderiales bacterium]